MVRARATDGGIVDREKGRVRPAEVQRLVQVHEDGGNGGCGGSFQRPGPPRKRKDHAVNARGLRLGDHVFGQLVVRLENPDSPGIARGHMAEDAGEDAPSRDVLELDLHNHISDWPRVARRSCPFSTHGASISHPECGGKQKMPRNSCRKCRITVCNGLENQV